MTPDDGDAEQTYAEINQLLNTVWQQDQDKDPWPAKPIKLGAEELPVVDSVDEDPPDAEAIEKEKLRLDREQQRLKSIAEVTDAVSNAVHDWHFDLFPPADKSDPDPDTKRSTGLAQRIANQLKHLDIPVERWSEDLSTTVERRHDGDTVGCTEWEA